MSPTQREDMAVAVIDATAPLYARIAELEKDLADAQEREALALKRAQGLEVARPILDHIRLCLDGKAEAPELEAPKALSFGGMTIWGAGSGAELLLMHLLWLVRDIK